MPPDLDGFSTAKPSPILTRLKLTYSHWRRGDPTACAVCGSTPTLRHKETLTATILDGLPLRHEITVAECEVCMSVTWDLRQLPSE